MIYHYDGVLVMTMVYYDVECKQFVTILLITTAAWEGDLVIAKNNIMAICVLIIIVFYMHTL